MYYKQFSTNITIENYKIIINNYLIAKRNSTFKGVAGCLCVCVCVAYDLNNQLTDKFFLYSEASYSSRFILFW